MSQHLQTQVRKVPLMAYVLVVLIITLLLYLALLRFSGSLACSGATDPNGGSCQPHANGLQAAGSGMDGNGHS